MAALETALSDEEGAWAAILEAGEEPIESFTMGDLFRERAVRASRARLARIWALG